MGQLFTQTYTNQTTSWLVHNWSTFGARTRHEQTWTHKTNHGPDLGEVTTFPLIVLFVHRHRARTQMSFCPRTPKLEVPKFPKLGLLQLWKPITFCVHLWLWWGLKQNYIPCRDFFNDMWHATYTQVNHGNSRLLVVRIQIHSLIFGLFWGHNLCFKYPNGSCELNLKHFSFKSFPII